MKEEWCAFATWIFGTKTVKLEHLLSKASLGGPAGPLPHGPPKAGATTAEWIQLSSIAQAVQLGSDLVPYPKCFHDKVSSDWTVQTGCNVVDKRMSVYFALISF